MALIKSADHSIGTREISRHMRLFLIALSYVAVFICGVYLGRYKLMFPISMPRSENLVATITDTNIDANELGGSRKNIFNFFNRKKSSSKTNPDKNSFIEIGKLFGTDKVTGHNYGPFYEKYLRKYRGSEVHLLEIGLGCKMPYGPGASMHVWRKYLGPRAKLYSIEFDQECGQAWYQTQGYKLQITMYYGSQENVTFLNTITSSKGQFDVIIDDGGHSMNQQLTSFAHLTPKVQSDGVYVIEDLHTSYMQDYGGNHMTSFTTIEFIKRLIDEIQSYAPKKSTNFIKTITSFEIADKICFFNIK